jgi:hypothetical protein
MSSQKVIKEHHLLPCNLKKLRLLDKTFSTMTPKVLKWVCINFHPLQEPQYNYKQQESINTSQVKMASASMIRFGLDPGKFICFLEGEYTSYSRNVQRTLSAVKDHISPEDLAHMKQILLDGYPAELRFEEPISNKMEMISRGSSKSFNGNPEIVRRQ